MGDATAESPATAPAKAAAPPEARVLIRPTAGWRWVDVGEMWRFRDLLWAMAIRDVKLRYRQTALGVVWVVLQPIVGAGIFAFVFGRVAKLESGAVPYFLFSYAGLLAWNAFSGTLNRATGALLANAGLVGKIYFPRLLLPFSAVFSGLLDFAVALLVLLGLLAARGVMPGWPLLTLPLWLALAIALALGGGMFCGALAVRYRDVSHIVPVAVQFLLYGSPVAYATAAVPAEVRPLFLLNPLAAILDGFRWAIYGQPLAEPWTVPYAAVVAGVAFLFGTLFFTRVEREFADVI